jgi:hypothetical protein
MADREELALSVTLDDRASTQIAAIRRQLYQLGGGGGATNVLRRQTQELTMLMRPLAQGTLSVRNALNLAGQQYGTTAVVGAALGYAFYNQMSQFKTFSDEITEMTTQASALGLSGAQYQNIQRQLENMGVSSQSAQSFIANFTRSIADMSREGSELRQRLWSMTSDPEGMTRWMQRMTGYAQRGELEEAMNEFFDGVNRAFEAELARTGSRVMAADLASNLMRQFNVSDDTFVRMSGRLTAMTHEEKDRFERRQRVATEYNRQFIRLRQEYENFQRGLQTALLGPFTAINKFFGDNTSKARDWGAAVGRDLSGVVRDVTGMLRQVKGLIQWFKSLQDKTAAEAAQEAGEAIRAEASEIFKGEGGEPASGLQDWLRGRGQALGRALGNAGTGIRQLMTGQDLTLPEGRQAGGPVSGGQPYVVGERGPELFVPQGAGTILPNTTAMSPGLARLAATDRIEQQRSTETRRDQTTQTTSVNDELIRLNTFLRKERADEGSAPKGSYLKRLLGIADGAPGAGGGAGGVGGGGGYGGSGVGGGYPAERSYGSPPSYAGGGSTGGGGATGTYSGTPYGSDVGAGTGEGAGETIPQGRGKGEMRLRTHAAQKGVNPQLVSMIQEASKSLPPGYYAQIESGRRSNNPRSRHFTGNAADVRIYGPDGKKVGGETGWYQNPKTFRLYEQFAQEVKKVQNEMQPNNPVTWGGYFSMRGKHYADSMHFSVGGEQMGGGGWQTGATGDLRRWLERGGGTSVGFAGGSKGFGDERDQTVPPVPEPGPSGAPEAARGNQMAPSTPSPNKPADQTAPAGQTTPPAASAGTSSSTAGGLSGLARQRQGFGAEVRGNPALRERWAALMLAENAGSPQSVGETMVNRASAWDTSLATQIDPNVGTKGSVKWNRGYSARGYYEPYQTNAYDKALRRLRGDPSLRSKIYQQQEGILSGSNVTNLATHNASAGVAARARKDQTVASVITGETYTRKDIPGTRHGAGVINRERGWHQRTLADMRSGNKADESKVAAREDKPDEGGGDDEKARDEMDKSLAADATKAKPIVTVKVNVKASADTKVKAEGTGSVKTETEKSTKPEGSNEKKKEDVKEEAAA